MNFPYLIRRALSTDLPAIYGGELDYIRQIEPQQETRWRNAMGAHLVQWIDNLDRMFIAELEGTTRGYCFWEVDGQDAVLLSIYVSPGERGKGLGRQLLEVFISDAASKNFRRLKLGVKADNPARFLYESVGFLHTHDAQGYRYYLRCLSG